MAFFDALGKTISEKGKEAAQKAKVLTETMQLKGQISTEENQIQTAFREIGKLAYESRLQADAQEYNVWFDKIDEAKDRIKELEEKINKAEGIRICKCCGAKVPSDAAFCNQCGTKVEDIVQIASDEEIMECEADETAAEIQDKKICPVCGESIDADSRFCTACGAEMTEGR